MRLTTVLFIVSLLQVSAATFGQKITMNQQNVALKTLFKEIRKQSGYNFYFDGRVVSSDTRSSIRVSDVSVEAALSALLDGLPLNYEIKDRLIIITKKAPPSFADRVISAFANIDVTGRVLNENGTAMAGASVMIKGTDRKTVTNDKGEFSFTSVDEKATLVISFIGYETKEIKAVKDLGQISLEVGTSRLDEVTVVSTGYQTLPKERATGSFSTIDNKLFNQQVGTDILSRLPAIANSMVMASGLAGRPQMMIRGLSTIRGPKDPLVIINNFPYDGDINNINPNIVESITILKDASASSIWGARAANGVIVITTKTGKLNQPVTIDFNSNVTIGNKPDLGYIRQMSSSDYIDMEQEMFKRNYYNSQINSSSRPVISPVVDLLNKARSGTITQQQAQQQIDALRDIDARDQFNEYMYKPSLNQQYYLSAQGGTEKFSWISAVGYDNNKDNLGATYQRINFRYQNAYHPIKQLSLTTGLYYTQNQNKSGRYGYNNVGMKGNFFAPYMQMADKNGLALPVNKDWNPNYIQTIGNGQLLDWKYYPLTNWQHHTTNSSASDILATAALDYQIINGLNATVNYQYERQWGVNTNLADENSYMARDYINRFAQIVNGNAVFIIPKGGYLDKSNSFLDANNLRGQLNFDRTYDRHSITAIAGAELRSNNSNGQQERFYGYNENNLTSGAVDYANTYPTLPNGSAFIVRNQNLTKTRRNFVSQYANATYTFDNRYVLSASVRRDASNLFGLSTNDQWNPFGSAGLSWKVSNERFYKVDALPYLNLRATYGFSGNIDPSMVAVSTISYSTQNSFSNGEPMAQFSNYYNPSLKWETSKMLNLAIDFRTKNDRISGSIEYYRKNGENLFGISPIDYTTGVPPSIVRNVASMKGNGWDIELRTLNIDRALKWRTILNFSWYQDKIVEYLIERTTARQYVATASVPISGISGQPVYAIYAYQWAGLDPATGEGRGFLNGIESKDYTSITGTGTKVEDLEYFGSAVPTKFGSFINAVSYKNISLQVGVSFKFSYFFRRNSINYTDLFSSWQGHSDYAQRWQKPGDEANTNVPVNLYTTNTNRDAFYSSSSVLVEKGDHIRLQYINLAYDVKLPAKTKTGFKSFQMYFNANNLGLLWKANKVGLDPDFGTRLYNVVNPANYAFGIRSKF